MKPFHSHLNIRALTLGFAAVMPLLPPHASAEPKVEYLQARSTVDGQPFMPRGIYAVNVSDMDRAAGYGFNIVQTYQFRTMSDDKVAEYLDEAGKRGLKVLFDLDMKASPAPEALATLRRRIERFKTHPALYAWYLADEPAVKNIKPEELKGIYRWIKDTDPDHPVFSSNWELETFKDACDVDMPQVYSGPPSALKAGALPRQHRTAAKHGVPWIAIANLFDTDFKAFNEADSEVVSPAQLFSAVQSGTLDEAGAQAKIESVKKNLENPPYKLRATFPDTPVKIRGQAFDLIAHGSNGLFYWLLQPEDSLHERFGYYTIFVRPPLRQALKDVLKETQDLWPRIGNPSLDSTTWYDAEFGNVFFWCRRQGDLVTVIAVNESEADWLSVRTTLPGLEAVKEVVATVNGEKRTVKVKNGVLEDNFRSNQAHVYLMTLK
ncbi:DUF4434 domain-containing protein [Luteolibacter ambystomatis]|uniref:DUF4434 domain-containing protein n=1 Tax=Luteolibacter ambystomatis TaxID=2824561 RepID=A0A975G5U9_9BACT|nr:glycoside hydrolase family 2 TIM barrel-domain containing protein [Luteolibacter ambystomatis]QUE49357.1 DUF4434 domain-containing protein [Luteolibacter ambystomatis]